MGPALQLSGGAPETGADDGRGMPPGYPQPMRCAECGHDLRGVASGAACPECGTVTPDDRRVLAPLRPGTVLLGYAWPYIALVLLIGAMSLAAGSWSDASSQAETVRMVLILAVIPVFLLLVVPINAARRTVTLMRRQPRREYMAPLLALTPRIVLVPLLAAAASTLLGVAITFGACMVAVAVGRS